MSTRDISWGVKTVQQPVRRADTLATIMSCLEILGTSTSWSPMGLSRENLMHTSFLCHRSHNMSGLIISDFFMECTQKCWGFFQSKMVTDWHFWMQLHQSSKELSAPLFPVLPVFKGTENCSIINSDITNGSEWSVNSGFSNGLTQKTDMCNVAWEAPQRKPQVGSWIIPPQKIHLENTIVNMCQCAPVTVCFVIKGGQFTEHLGILLCFLQKYHTKFSMSSKTTRLLGPCNQYSKLRGYTFVSILSILIKDNQYRKHRNYYKVV